MLSATYAYDGSQSTNGMLQLTGNQDHLVGDHYDEWKGRGNGVRLTYNPETTVFKVALRGSGWGTSCKNKKHMNNVKFSVVNSKLASSPSYYADAYNIPTTVPVF